MYASLNNLHLQKQRMKSYCEKIGWSNAISLKKGTVLHTIQKVILCLTTNNRISNISSEIEVCLITLIYVCIHPIYIAPLHRFLKTTHLLPDQLPVEHLGDIGTTSEYSVSAHYPKEHIFFFVCLISVFF